MFILNHFVELRNLEDLECLGVVLLGLCCDEHVAVGDERNVRVKPLVAVGRREDLQRVLANYEEAVLVD